MPKLADAEQRTEDTTSAYFGDIVKFSRNADGDLEVFGKATGSDLDDDGQRMSAAFLEKAMPAWMAFGNVREQHAKIAAGVGKVLEKTEGGDWMLKSLCTDPVTAHKIETGTLKGYSINVRNARVTKGTPSAPNGEIIDGVIAEISYVDRPCLPTATISICKAAASGDLEPVDVADAVHEEPENDGKPVEKAKRRTIADLEKALGETNGAVAELAKLVRTLAKRKYTQAQRDDAADDGSAMPDGSFPIKTKDDLANAVKLAGSAKDPKAAKAHIKRRAKALGAADAIPDTWKSAKPGAPEDGTTVVASLDKAAMSAMIVDATEVAVEKALAKSGEAHKAEISDLRAQLEKVLALPRAGAPVIVGPSPRAQVQTMSRRDEYLEKAQRASDPAAKESWLLLAGKEPANS
jgi:hypothetical protein